MTDLITLDQLQKIYQEAPKKRLEKWVAPLNRAMSRFEINTPQRIRMFLAQLGWESGQCRYVRELASGKAYDGRADLGNVFPGDGSKYRGRGLLQLTGRNNYQRCQEALGLPLLEQPELLEVAENAADSSAWFWHTERLNSLCDLGKFKELTKRINGGYNGYEGRLKLYQRAMDVIH